MKKLWERWFPIRKSPATAYKIEESYMEYYRHEIPGRLRIRVPSLKKNPRNIRELKAVTKGLPGINSISVNTITGSVVFLYNPESMSSHEILSLLTQEGFLDQRATGDTGRHSKRVLDQIGAGATKALVGLVLNRVLEGSPLSVVTAFI